MEPLVNGYYDLSYREYCTGFFFVFKILIFNFFQREGKGGRKRGRETSNGNRLPHPAPPSGTPACPGHVLWHAPAQMGHVRLTWSSVYGHLGCFYFLVIMSSAAVTTCVQDFVWTQVLLGRYLEMKLLGHIVILFNVLRNCQTVFQKSCPILYSYQQHRRVPISLHSHQHLLLVFPYYGHSTCCVLEYTISWNTREKRVNPLSAGS